MGEEERSLGVGGGEREGVLCLLHNVVLQEMLMIDGGGCLNLTKAIQCAETFVL